MKLKTNQSLAPKNIDYKIYSVKPIKFEHKTTDPFGFDDFAEKFSAKYLPFSGSVSKPSYFLFVAFVEKLIKDKYSHLKVREQKEIKTRLEKLLVYCWKDNLGSEVFSRGKNIIGNSFSIHDIQPYSGKGWVIQNCYKIYTFTGGNFKPEKTLNTYLRLVGDAQMKILEDFLSVKINPGRKDLAKLAANLSKQRNSLFRSHILSKSLQDTFRNELTKAIVKRRGDNKKDEYFVSLKEFLTGYKIEEKRFWDKTVLNTKFVFFDLNKWFSAFVEAVDSDIKGNHNKNQWSIVDDYHKKIKLKSFLPTRPSKRIWVEYNKQDKRYQYSYDYNKKSGQWESYFSRQDEENKDYFFVFRHNALLKLLRELSISR